MSSRRERRPTTGRPHLAFALGCLAVAGCPLSETGLEIEPDVAPPTALVLGLDGADWDILMPLIEAGFVPTIGNLVMSGARADFDCEPAWPQFACFCPPVWVSIATGQPFAVHGINLLSQASSERRAPAIWQLLDAYGETSVMSSWRNTDPPEEGQYYVFTESGNALTGRVNYKVWGSGDQPPPDPRPAGRPADIYERLDLLPFTSERLDSIGVMAKDRSAARGFIRLAQSWPWLAPSAPRPRLNMIILHSIDKSEHVSWGLIQQEPGDPIDTDRVLDAARRWQGPVFGPSPFAVGNAASQYLEADAFLEELLQSAAYDYVIFLSDHGMDRTAATGLPGGHGPDQPAAHVGIFAISGPGIPQDVVLDTVSVLDVAPTLAYLLGLPVAENLPGDLLLDAFSAAWVDENPPDFIEHW